MNILVFGRNSKLFRLLSDSKDPSDRLTQFKDDTLFYEGKLGDVVFIASNNLEYIKRMRLALPLFIPIIVFTRTPTWFTLVDCLNITILPYPITTFSIKRTLDSSNKLIKMHSILLSSLAGKSRQIEELRSNIIKSSQHTLPIHIYGETGTGKTLVARLIHSLSQVRKEIVYLNCANLNTSIAESDLFGHAKGAFTNALNSRKGLISQADNSTLFLDEIGNLNLDKQGKLLDTIENGSFRNIGDDNCQRSSFRLITAGQSSLEELLEKKKLRKDFYYRISNITLYIQPLREHLEDIPELVKHYERNNGIENGRITDYTPLMQCKWRGNFRELLHYLDRVFALVKH